MMGRCLGWGEFNDYVLMIYEYDRLLDM
jgi:hypothetical protein